MTQEIFTDPRDRPWSLLVRVDTNAVIGENDFERPQRLQGEFLIDIAGIWGSGVFVTLRRLGLSSAGPPTGSPTGEISISTSRGGGSMRLILAATPRVELDLHVEAMVTYGQIAKRGEIPLEPDSHSAPSELFRGSLTARLRLQPGSPIERRISLEEGRITLHKTGESLGAVRSLGLDLAALPAFSLLTSAQPAISIPLRPVRFPLGAGLKTGGTWGQQLARANEIWSLCSVSFDGLDFFDHPNGNLARSRDLAAILDAHRENGVIEVFFVASNLTGHTYPTGTALAGIIMPEPATGPADPNLLAHELCHVLGGCDAQEDWCGKGLWKGAVQTITDPVRPISRLVTNTICADARKYAQPLLRTLLE